MMKVYKLGRVGDLLSTTFFHACARLDMFGLILVEPEDTYISLGYFDNTQEILDLQRVKSLGIPVIRREIGGGTVLLAPGQVFYQLVIPKSLTPFKVEEAYRKFSQPVMETYRRLGIEVEYRPINDIVVKNSQRKISGQGAGDIHKAFVFVGNILLRFNTGLMAEVLNVPDKDFVKKVLDENLTWVEREKGKAPDFWEVADILEFEFKKLLPLETCQETPEEALELANKLKEEFTSEDVLFEETGRRHRLIKMREGIFVRNKHLEVNGKKVSLSMIVEGQTVKLCKLNGLDLENLEREIVGLKYDQEAIKNMLEKKSLSFLFPLFWD
ncbi:lipoate--protein ligase family protein [Thermocrinis sp.]